MQSIEELATGLNTARGLYFLLLGLSFYLLGISRSGEVRTVWQFMNPLFLPTFFGTTLVLLILIFSTEKTSYKLTYVIVHSFLCHSLFLITFPAGNVGVQQQILGRTRLTFDNVILHGWPPGPITGVVERIYHWSRSLNFQTALSVVLARMSSLDVYWVHLPLAPLLWSLFVPMAIFKATKELGADDKTSVLSSLLISLFPWAISGGTISVPNSIGYVFFAFSFCLSLRCLSTSEPKLIFAVMGFSFITLLAHHLAGISLLSLLVLAFGLKSYETEKKRSSVTSKLSFLVSFAFSASILPLSLVYLKIFYPIYTYFDLSRLHELSSFELIWIFIFGGSAQFELSTILVQVASTMVGLASIVYVWLKITRMQSSRYHRMVATFLILAFALFMTQYRILKFLMRDVPFAEGRLWVFRDFIVIPLLSVFIVDVSAFLHGRIADALSKLKASRSMFSSLKLNMKTVTTSIMAGSCLIGYILIPIAVSGGITVSLYRAYPRYGPLQTTMYEIEAVRFIDQNTKERYVVICDQWIILAAQMFVGIYNPRAFYFGTYDPKGLSLFIKMKQDPTQVTMLEAMQYNDATIAYFIIEQPRIGTEEFNRLATQALEGGLQTYKTFGAGKLLILYYEKTI